MSYPSFTNKTLPKEVIGWDYIYELIDPRDFKTKYIGVTKAPNSRYSKSLDIEQLKKSAEKSEKTKWLVELKRYNLIPFINIIDLVLHEEWEYWEIWWIALYKSWGIKLTNGTEGGGGFRGVRHYSKTKEHREKQAKTLKKGFESGRIIHVNKGKTYEEIYGDKSEEQKDKLRTNSSFLSMSEEDKLKMYAKRAQSHTGHKRNDEAKKNSSEALIKYFLSQPDYRCIVQMNLDDTVVKCHKLLKDAAIEVTGNKKNSGNILHCINGKYKSCGGYKWRYGTKKETEMIICQELV